MLQHIMHFALFSDHNSYENLVVQIFYNHKKQCNVSPTNFDERHTVMGIICHFNISVDNGHFLSNM
jgi:hypothetical protein